MIFIHFMFREFFGITCVVILGIILIAGAFAGSRVGQTGKGVFSGVVGAIVGAAGGVFVGWNLPGLIGWPHFSGGGHGGAMAQAIGFAVHVAIIGSFVGALIATLLFVKTTRRR